MTTTRRAGPAIGVSTKRSSGGSRRSKRTAIPVRQAHTPAGELITISYTTPGSNSPSPCRVGVGAPASSAGVNSK